MPQHWTEYTEDELLNFDGPETTEIARRDRIVQKHGIDAMHELKDCVTDLGQTIYAIHQELTDQADKVTLTLTDVGNRVTDLDDNIGLMHEGLSEKADEAFKLYRREAQAKQQKAIRWLAIVIGASTVVYTLVTGASVWATIQSNHIQREMLELETHAVSR